MYVKIANETKDINICYKLREIIFIKGQNVSKELERDNYDDIATHFMLLDNENVPIGVARVLKNSNYAIVGRVGILEEYRKNGAGLFLMQSVIDYCKHNNFPKIVLGSQEHAIDFYKKLGFEVIGERYMDAKIPHFKMHLNIN